MNIIIEGYDGTGKSTLAKKLAKKLGLKYQHQSEPKTYLEYIKDLSKDNTIFDRFFLGQFVYNTEDERKLTLDELKKLVKEINSNTIFIYVNTDPQTVFNRLLKRGEFKSLASWSEFYKDYVLKTATYEIVIEETKIDPIIVNGKEL